MTIILPYTTKKELDESTLKNIEALSEENKKKFIEEYETSKKSILFGYITFFVFFHYGYFKRWDLNLLFFFLTPFIIWFIVDIFRIPSLVREYNNRLATNILNKLNGHIEKYEMESSTSKIFFKIFMLILFAYISFAFWTTVYHRFMQPNYVNDFTLKSEWTNQRAVCINRQINKYQEFYIEEYIKNPQSVDLGDYCVLDTGEVKFRNTGFSLKEMGDKIKYDLNTKNLYIDNTYNFCVWTYEAGTGEFPSIQVSNNVSKVDIFGKKYKVFCEGLNGAVNLYTEEIKKEETGANLTATSSDATDATPDEYTGEITQVGGFGSRYLESIFYASWIYTKGNPEQWYLNDQKYKTYSMNNGGDNVGFYCIKGFDIVSATSSTGNYVTYERDFGSMYLSLDDKQKTVNKVKFTCLKR
jgi:hypothetical protein